MVAGALKVSPMLEKLEDDQETYDAYFPAGSWVDLVDETTIVDTKKSGGAMVSLPAHRYSTAVHLRPGAIIPFQNNSGMIVKTVKDIEAMPISLLVNRDDNGYATGTLLLDDGLTASELETSQYEYYQFHHQAKSIQFFMPEGIRNSESNLLNKVKIYNAADLKDTSFACYLDSKTLSPTDLNIIYDSDRKILTLRPFADLTFHDVHSI